MNVGDVCRRQVVCTYQSVVLAEAARQMLEEHVGCLVVVQQGEQGRVPVGVLTDRDIVVGAVAQHLDPRTLTVGEVMTREVATVREQDSVVNALRLMRRRGIRRLPVVAPDGVLQGIVTLDDLLDDVAQKLNALAEAVESEQHREIRERD
ncbi:MAG TPA: CBS domain-containing protein [Azonexus sp.]|nr:CBS domain-containing protein [Azonexus sp.]